MNRRLAEAVIRALREDRTVSSELFAPFDERDWCRTEKWLHTSGLALYFLASAKKRGLQNVIPTTLLHRLEQNAADNRTRNKELLHEFVKINMEFQRAGLLYANLKGFALAPDAYADPALRYQHDLDFLMSPRDAERCLEVLKAQGYEFVAVSGDTCEFQIGAIEISSMRDLYKARSRRSLEVHFLSAKEQRNDMRQGDRLARLQLQTWNEFEFPALSEFDKFLSQSLHLFKHFQSEWSRAAWMLEHATYIRSRQHDEAFWQEVIAAINDVPEMKLGIGVATLITSRTFGVAAPTEFLERTVGELPASVRLWIDRYEDEVVFVEFPGSKLYLLLGDVISQESAGWREERRRKLLPLRPPPKVILTKQTDRAGIRIRAKLFQVRFFVGRLWFHIFAGLRYKIEAARWKRFVQGSRAGAKNMWRIQ